MQRVVLQPFRWTFILLPHNPKTDTQATHGLCNAGLFACPDLLSSCYIQNWCVCLFNDFHAITETEDSYSWGNLSVESVEPYLNAHIHDYLMASCFLSELTSRLVSAINEEVAHVRKQIRKERLYKLRTGLINEDTHFHCTCSRNTQAQRKEVCEETLNRQFRRWI